MDPHRLNDRIRVALVDDQSIVLEGLRTLLDTMPTLWVDYATTQPTELISEMRRNPVDVVVSDIRMPGLNGFCTLYTSDAADEKKGVEFCDVRKRNNKNTNQHIYALIV